MQGTPIACIRARLVTESVGHEISIMMARESHVLLLIDLWLAEPAE